MKFDLFSTTCFEQHNDNFGIYDDAKNPASVIPSENINGIAKVENKNKWNIYFIPVDKNINYNKSDGKKASLCDAMLISINSSKKYGLYFIELKDKERGWRDKGISQLKETILAFTSSYNCSIPCIYVKKAFLCNKKHPNFEYAQKSIREKFEQDTGFELRINVHVLI